MKKSLAIIIMLSVVFSCPSASAAQLPMEDNFESGVTGFGNPSGSGSENATCTSVANGSESYAKIRAYNTSTSSPFYDYNVSGMGILTTEYDVVTVEARIKISTGVLQMAMIGLNNNATPAPANFAYFTAYGGFANFVNSDYADVKPTYLRDVNAASPDFSSGWQTVWFEIEMKNNLIRAYWNDRSYIAVYTIGTTPATTITKLTGIRFNVQTTANSAVESIAYVDYLKVYKGYANVPDAVLLDNNFSAAEDVQKFVSNSGSPTTLVSPKGYAKLSQPAGAAASALIPYADIIKLNINEKKYPDAKVTMEARVKISSLVYNQIGIHGNGGGSEYPVVATIGMSNGRATFPNSSSMGSAASYITDSNPFNPNYSIGWKTIWVEMDFKNNVTKVYFGNSDNPVTYPLSDNTGTIRWFRFTQNTDPIRENTVFVDYLRIYTGEARDVPNSKIITGLSNAIASGAVEYIIPEGKYFLDNAIILSDLDGFTLKGEEGKTVELIFSGNGNGIQMDNCKNTTVKNLTIDYLVPSFSQGVITHVNKKTLTVIIDEDDGTGHWYDVPSTYDTRWFASTRGIYFDPMLEREIPSDYNDTIASINPGVSEREIVVKLNTLTPTRPLVPGDKMAFIRRAGGSPLYITGGENNSLVDLNLYSSWGFGISDTKGVGGNVYTNVKITKRPRSNRILSTSADGFHANRIVNGPVMTNCEIGYTADDSLNVHSFYSIVTKNDNGTLTILSPFGVDFDENSELTFYDFLTVNKIGNFKLASVTPASENDKVAAKEQLSNIKTDLSLIYGVRSIAESEYSVSIVTPQQAGIFDDIAVYTLLESSEIASGTGFVLRNSILHDSHVRGALIKAKGALIENNKFYNMNGHAIDLVMGRYFLEGTIPKDIIIRNNEIYNVNLNNSCVADTIGAIVAVATPSLDFNALADNYSIENLTIEGNTITNSGGAGIFAANLSGGKIVRNTVINPFSTDAPASVTDWNVTPLLYGINIQKSQDVEIKENQVLEMNPSMLGKLWYNDSPIETNGYFWIEEGEESGMKTVALRSNSEGVTYKGFVIVVYSDDRIGMLPLNVNQTYTVSPIGGYKKIFMWNENLAPYGDVIEP